MKIVQISDTHLTHRDGVTGENFRLLVEHVNTVLRPDLVVHTGDLVVVDPDDAADRARAHELMAGFTAPVRVLPGNHDVGDGATRPWKGIPVTDARVAAFERVWGPDHWRHDLGGWTLLGLDSELFGSGLDREAAQWAWLEDAVADLGTGRPTLVFLHKPIWAAATAPTDHQLDIGDASRGRLLDLLGRVALRGVGSGHLHRYRRAVRGAALEVWAPSAAFVAGSVGGHLPDALEQLGVVVWELGEDSARVAFRAPADLHEVDVLDVPALHEAVAAIDARALPVGAS